jgi:hypothetical protein
MIIERLPGPQYVIADRLAGAAAPTIYAIIDQDSPDVAARLGR